MGHSIVDVTFILKLNDEKILKIKYINVELVVNYHGLTITKYLHKIMYKLIFL